MNPVTVRTTDGSYVIPVDGAWGSFAWARSASLISIAYHQIGDEASSKKWMTEYSRRLQVYQLLEQGKDAASIIGAVGQDVLQYPAQIASGIKTVGIGLWGLAAAALAVLLVKGVRK